MDDQKITPENIYHLERDQIFVFGSNIRGIHGAGAARLALNHFGAKMGQGVGIQGQSLAIPTANLGKGKLPLYEISLYIKAFIAYAYWHKDLTFLVTKIGCGLAGYSEAEIAPLFKDALGIENIALPVDFINILSNSRLDTLKL